jgi:diguanylate cyclase (GGDEF)-like protein/PAS domain S-box-containing protein
MTVLEPGGGILHDESYEELYEHAPCGLLSFTLGGIVVRVNETLLTWIGYSRTEVVGAPLTTLLSPGSQLFYESRFLPVLRLQGEAREIALELRRVDGSTLHVLTNASLVAHDNAEIVRLAVFDSTERHTWERDLVVARRQAEESEARVRALQDAASTFAQSNSVLSVAQGLVESAREAFSATHVAVLLLKDSVALDVVAGVHPLLDHLPPDTLLAGSEAIRVDDLFALSSIEEGDAFSPEVGRAMRLARIGAITSTPIESEKGLFGVLTCSFERARGFDQSYRQLNRALARQASQVIGRLLLQEQLASEAQHDQLTGLANRALLQDRLEESIAGAQRSREPLVVLFVDLDGFKTVNDNLGHVVGDAALVEAAARLRDAVRVTDVVGRFGGDEFVIICPDTDEHAAMTVAERIRASIAEPLDAVDARYPVTASVGVALWEPGAVQVDADTLFRVAVDAMYRCKDAGKDCVTLVRA